jgi:glycerol-3-phosphate dehydrogenase (NAD(P)+)
VSYRIVTLVGNGGFGTALSLLLFAKGIDVRVLGHDAAYAAETARRRENAKYLPGVPLPEKLLVTADPDAALRGAQCVVSAVPTQFVAASMASSVLSRIGPKVPIVSVSKGVEIGTFRRPSQVIASVLPRHPLAVLSGPSHAEEVARGMPTSVVVASADDALARRVQGLFSSDRFRVYTSPDTVGVEIAGALKNVIAIAAGIGDGLGFGDNAKAALMTRGLVEMSRLGAALGARKATFSGLSGLGDLVTTCTSRFGRNRELGERIGRGETLAAILSGMAKVAEGVPTTKAVRALARKLGVEVPITDEVHRILFGRKDPRVAVRDLMRRGKKSEAEDLR